MTYAFPFLAVVQIDQCLHTKAGLTNRIKERQNVCAEQSALSGQRAEGIYPPSPTLSADRVADHHVGLAVAYGMQNLLNEMGG